MLFIICDYKWQVEKNLLTLRARYPVPGPILFRIPFVPLKATARRWLLQIHSASIKLVGELILLYIIIAYKIQECEPESMAGSKLGGHLQSSIGTFFDLSYF
jgi:hypothetical protein